MKNKNILQQSNDRFPLYDASKAICIISVVMGHCGIFSRFVYFYHLPVFFFLSAFFLGYEKYSIKTFIYKKIKSLYIPYVIISFAFAVLFDTKNLLHVKYVARIFLFDSKAPLTGTFWFIPCLFINSFIAFVTGKYIRKEKYQILVFCLYACAAFFFQKWNVHFYYNAHLIPWIQLIYCLGIFYKKHQVNRIFENSKFAIVSFCLSTIIFCLFFCFSDISINIVASQFPSVLIWILFIAIGACFVFGLSSFVQNIKIIQVIGKESFYIMSFHFLAFAMMNICLSEFKNFRITENLLYPHFSLLYLLAGIIFPLIINFIVSAIKHWIGDICKN